MGIPYAGHCQALESLTLCHYPCRKWQISSYVAKDGKLLWSGPLLVFLCGCKRQDDKKHQTHSVTTDIPYPGFCQSVQTPTLFHSRCRKWQILVLLRMAHCHGLVIALSGWVAIKGRITKKKYVRHSPSSWTPPTQSSARLFSA